MATDRRAENILILKLGIIRFATSLLVVLMTHVLNRVLIVEFQTPAGLIAFIFAFQHLATPSGLIAGYFSDKLEPSRRRRTPFILGGMFLSLAVMPFFPHWGLALAAAPADRQTLWAGVVLFSLFGVGTTVSATAVNALLVDGVSRRRRGLAMTLVWILTLGGFIIGAGSFDYLWPGEQIQQLPHIFWLFTLGAAGITIVSLRGLEQPQAGLRPRPAAVLGLAQSLRSFGQSSQALIFFCFLAASVFFLAMHIFILTPFGGEVLQLPVGETTKFGMVTAYGTLFGMGAAYWRLRPAEAVGDTANLPLGLGLGALAFGLLGLSAWQVHAAPAIAGIWLLGFAKGFYNAGLAHLTMRLAYPVFGGVFMGLWNLISGLALALGEMAGGFFLAQGRRWVGSASVAYGGVFLLEALGLLGCLLILRFLHVERYWQQLSRILALPGLPGLTGEPDAAAPPGAGK
ncbi:MAG: MFS transporter [Desulfobacca sp.]|uniref:MFS transporter n=1 Tax=Desulfobacca sp. TaxID=2067990 RepID=UPI00404B62E5